MVPRITHIVYLFISMIFLKTAFAEPGEVKQVPDYKKVDQMVNTALKSRNPSIAVCAFGMYLEKGMDPGSKLTAETIIKFSKKKGFYHKASALASFYDIEKMIPNLLEYNNGEFAAQLLATKAYHNIMFQTGGDIRDQPDENGEVKKKDSRIRLKVLKEPQEVSLKIPEQLFNSRSQKTQYLAILAASYSMQKEYEEIITKIPVKNGEIAAAKILFKIMTGGAVPDAEVKAAFVKCKKSTGRPLEGPVTALSEVDMAVPAMATLCEALGRTKDKKYLAIIHQASLVRDERIKVDAVRAIRKIANESSIPYLIKILYDCEWPTLIEVCLALGENPHKAAIAPLIKRFSRETGRFRLDVNYALASICGERHGYTADEWIKWWAKNKNTFTVDRAKSQSFRESTRLQDVGVRPTGLFYSIQLYSDRCCFSVDYSLSMRGEKIESLKENMETTLSGLDKHVMYNISEFGGDVNLMYDKALTNNLKKALKYVNDSRLTVYTRTMDSMERSMLIPEVDTVYFLSDGGPCRGQIEDWLTIQKMLRLMNRYRHIAFSTINFKAGSGNATRMADVASQNYGHFEEIK